MSLNGLTSVADLPRLAAPWPKFCFALRARRVQRGVLHGRLLEERLSHFVAYTIKIVHYYRRVTRNLSLAESRNHLQKSGKILTKVSPIFPFILVRFL